MQQKVISWRGKVDIPKLLVGNVRGIIIAASLNRSISGEVLDAGRNVSRAAKRDSLKAANLRCGHLRAKVWPLLPWWTSRVMPGGDA